MQPMAVECGRQSFRVWLGKKVKSSDCMKTASGVQQSDVSCGNARAREVASSQVIRPSRTTSNPYSEQSVRAVTNLIS